MRVAVFGSGLMGSAVARDLVGSKDVDEVIVCDVNRPRLTALARSEHSSKLLTRHLDIHHSAATTALLRRYEVGVGALPPNLSENAIRSAVRSGANFVDLIYGWRFQENGFHSLAKKKGITIVPACGLAPGLSNILAMSAAEQMDRVDEVHIKTGGIPERPKPPLNYRIVFSFEAVLDEYMRKARIIRNGKLTEVPALSGLETVRFPQPIGTCECFYTDGLSTLVRTLKGVRKMDEKTIRWPGHVAQIRTLIECGLLEDKPARYEGSWISPRKFVSKILSERISLGNEHDLTLLRVDVTGRKAGKHLHHRYQMIDRFDTKGNITSMARTTAFPCSAVAQFLGKGEVMQKGLVPPELAITGKLLRDFMRYLQNRRIKITSRIKYQNN